MANWRSNKPVSYATDASNVGATYTGWWTGMRGAWIRDDRSGSLSKVFNQQTSPLSGDMTITGGVAAQDDALRFNGTTGFLSTPRDSDLEPSSAISLLIAFRIISLQAADQNLFERWNTSFSFASVSFELRAWNGSNALDPELRMQLLSTGYVDSGISSTRLTTGIDYIAIGRWASGGGMNVRVYNASSGANLIDQTGTTYTDTIDYSNTAAGDGWNIGLRENAPQYANIDFGGAYLLSRRITDQECLDIVADFYGPVRVASVYSPPVLPYVYTTFKSAV